MALPWDRKEAAAVVRAAAEVGVKPFFLGNGSNLLVSDRGYEGFVVKSSGLDQTREVNHRLKAESGIPLARLAMAALAAASPVWSLPTASPAPWEAPW